MTEQGQLDYAETVVTVEDGQNYTYAGSNNADDVAWYTSNTNDIGTRPVGTKRANKYGLHDMSGNVWEWVLDEWHGSYLGAPSNGSQAWGNVPKCRQRCDKGSAWRVVRGGSWDGNADDLRVAFRYNRPPGGSGDYSLGFRLRRT